MKMTDCSKHGMQVSEEVFLAKVLLHTARLRELQDERDIEVEHIEADGILCDILCDLGYGFIVDEYDKIQKYYS